MPAVTEKVLQTYFLSLVCFQFLKFSLEKPETFRKFLFHWDKPAVTYIHVQTHTLWGTAFINHIDFEGTNPNTQSPEQVQVCRTVATEVFHSDFLFIIGQYFPFDKYTTLDNAPGAEWHI